jgi:hypothetical protein
VRKLVVSENYQNYHNGAVYDQLMKVKGVGGLSNSEPTVLLCDRGSTEIRPNTPLYCMLGLYINITSLRMRSMQIRLILCFSRILSVCVELSYRQAGTGI